MITPEKIVFFTWSIFWPLIKSWIVRFVRFWHGLNTINFFLKFNESLLALNHICSLFSSAFSILVKQSLSLWETNTFVSSANNSWILNLKLNWDKILIFNMNRVFSSYQVPITICFNQLCLWGDPLKGFWHELLNR